MHRALKIIVEKHPDGYSAYPLGLKGVVVGRGETDEGKRQTNRILDESEGSC